MTGLTVKDSCIHGLGLFATMPIDKGLVLGVSHKYDERFQNNYIRTPLGGFINHHEIPNCKAVFRESDAAVGSLKHIRIITLKELNEGDEITVKYVINKLDDPNWEFEYEASQ